MAALDLEARSPERQPLLPGAVTTRRLEGALVAPRVSKPVPNHIADTSKSLSLSLSLSLSSCLPLNSSFTLYICMTHYALAEIFSSSRRNGILQTKPSVIHFDGYQVGRVHQQTLVSVGLDDR